MIINVFVFLPFGVLYPLSRANATWKKTMLIGFVYIMSIEALQPFFGRAFDINDICLYMIGVSTSTLLFFGCKKVVKAGTRFERRHH